jgi:hypothetical protein
VRQPAMTLAPVPVVAEHVNRIRRPSGPSRTR